MKYLFLLSGLLFFSQDNPKDLYQSENLRIYKVTENTFVHVSYLETEGWGKVACNGMIFKNDGEAAIFDSPTNNVSALELINWLQNDQGLTITAVVPTHWHHDCLGGLEKFHEKGVASYANELTVQLAGENEYIVPQNGFKSKKKLKIGGEKIELFFPGAGHTFDNIVAYVPSERVMFGGCLVKSLKAGRGWTGDGDTTQWSSTIKVVKSKFPDAKYIVPGHGKPGDQSLLDYTMKMFDESQK